MSKILAGLRTLGAGLAEAAGEAASVVGRKAGELASQAGDLATQGAAAVGADGLVDAATQKARAVKLAERETRIHIRASKGEPLTLVITVFGIEVRNSKGEKMNTVTGGSLNLKYDDGLTLQSLFDPDTGNTEITISSENKSTVE